MNKSKIIALLFLAGTFASCQMTDKNPENDVTSDMLNNPNSGYEDVDPTTLPILNWKSETADFGTITQGERVKAKFEFTNAGQSALVISSVKAGCGCTVIDSWPRNPIAPGESGTVEVEFNSEGKSGAINKSVTVVANTSPSSTMVFLKGEVVAPQN